MLLQDVLKEFVFECEIRKLSKRTIKGYRNNNALFFTFIAKEFGITELEKVIQTHVKGYIRFMMKEGSAETYINRVLKCFRAFFKYSIQEEYINDSPCKKVSWQKEPMVIIKSFIDVEVSSMLKVFDYSDYLHARNKTILAFLFDTGIRNLELCMLKHQDIKGNYITIFGKGNKERQVGKSPLLEKHIIKYVRMKEYYFKD
ncbi:MAG: tyrosine-type recombinase/integrase [Ruminiclostridium sp.]